MPTFLAPLNGVTHSEALKEALTHADTSAVILTTLELRNPNFRDAAGNPTAIRVVRDHAALTATLEADAPLNPGAAVEFQAIPFEFTRPSERDGGAPPEITLALDNVSREVMRHVMQTLGTLDTTSVTLRDYLSSDTSAPHTDPPLTLELTAVTASVERVDAKATLGNLANSRFPADRYDAARYPGLSAR